MKIIISENQVKKIFESFDSKISNDIKRLSKKYNGRNIVWYGDPKQMIVINKDYVDGTFGNIYYPDKIEQLVNLIKDSDEKIEIECAYGTGEIISIIDVLEEQTSYVSGNFSSDYDGKDNPSSTGDETLDEYLGTEDLSEYFEYIYMQDEVQKYFEDNKTLVARGVKSPKQIIQSFNKFPVDEDYEDSEALQEYLELELDLKNAIDNEEGDLGDFRVTMRDGHHRMKAAIAVGEQYICLNLVKDDIEKFKGYYTKV